MQYTRLWIALALVIVGSFGVLGSVRFRAVTQAPPMPQQVVSADGQVLFDHSTIRRGQGVWQSLGGQQIGSIWGHGAYIAPDWTADWLHREAVTRLEQWARDTGAADFAALSGEQQAALQTRLKGEMRTNTYDPATGHLRISATRGEAFEALVHYYAEIFAQGREAYAIPRGALTDPVKARDMATFFWWTAWAASTNRPGQEVTYTQNWPHEPLVGNTPTGSGVVRRWRNDSLPWQSHGGPSPIYTTRRTPSGRWGRAAPTSVWSRCGGIEALARTEWGDNLDAVASHLAPATPDNFATPGRAALLMDYLPIDISAAWGILP